MSHQYIAVIDFGSQFAHLIARRIRQHGVLAKIFTPDTNPTEYADAKGIILSGGPKSTIAEDAVPYNHRLFDIKVPILGLCYGHQLIALHFGGQVAKGKTKEYGQADLTITQPDVIFTSLSKKQRVWMSHWDVVTQVPAGFTVIGRTADCDMAAMVNPTKKIWSFQYHLEVHHTTHGLKMLENFLFKICQVRADWNIAKIEQEIIKDIKKTIPNHKQVFVLLSGGVDSTVTFALLEKALGKKRVYGLHIDNGFMRLNESKQVLFALKKAGFGNMHMVDASERFLQSVAGMTDPEKKRQAIGEMFIEIANEEIKKMLLLDNYILGQGTIYPDTIESGGTKHADKIKTHHNQIDLIKQMIKDGKVIEPLRNLYKDEVRAIGKRLGIATSLLQRQPFPGPGLAIRTLCSDGQNPVVAAGILPMKSVGVQGDERSYKHPAIITKPKTWSQLNELSVRLTNEVFHINRVLWLVAGKNISQAKMHPAYLTKARLDLLRQADDIVQRVMRQDKLTKDIWQFPVVLVPFGRNQTGETIVLRPIQSQEAMTVNFYPMPRASLKKITKQLLKLPKVEYVCYDVTNKPPATIEWE
ncbi:MAG: glutamine-hydrolyzing GMP synthase [Patescibacteria group bacterium]